MSAVADGGVSAGDAGSLRAAHRGVSFEFFVFGFIVAALGVHVPSIRAHYGLDEASLSVALLSVSGGAVLCLMFVGRIIGRIGARRATVLGALVMCGALSLLLVTPYFWLLLPLMAVFGAAVGLFDVAINTEGTHLEERIGRKIVSTMHGLWSLGGMVGAGAGAALLKLQVAPLTQLQLAAATCVAVALLASVKMLPVHVHDDAPDAGAPRPKGASRLLLTLGVLALLALLAEGSMYDWSVLYIQQELGAEPAVAALGYSSFSAAMAATRFTGDWLRARIPSSTLLAGSAMLSAVAMAVVLLSGNVWVALLGFGLVGVGLANVVPILFIAGSRVPGVSSASGIAAVSSLGYFGSVTGPPLVGGIAHASSLTWGMAVVVAASVALALGARRVS